MTLTATVADTSVASIVPQGGSVTFTDTVLGKATVLHGGVPVPVNGGNAELPFLPASGQHTITAHYSGVDASFASSTATAMLSVYNKDQVSQIGSVCLRPACLPSALVTYTLPAVMPITPAMPTP